MKKYLKYIIVLAVFLAAGCAVYTAPTTGQAENYAGADKISFLRQLITADASTSRTIMRQMKNLKTRQPNIKTPQGK